MMSTITAKSDGPTKHFHRAEHIGSLLRPRHLHEARTAHKSGKLDVTALRRIEDECIRDLVAFQESVGLKIITDGEFRRENWWIDFIGRIGGVEIIDGDNPSFKRKADGDFLYVPKSTYVADKLNRPAPILVEDFTFVASLTDNTPKITLPSPSRMHFHGGRASVSKDAYPDIEAFFADVAAIYRTEIADLEAAGCRYIQIDDPLFSYFISERMRNQLVECGEDPDALLERYVQLINDCIRERHDGTRVAIHICRGNSRSGWISEGGYERIAEMTFGGLAVDSFFLEYDDERSGGFEPLRFMPSDKFVILGLVGTKFPEVERMEDLCARIDDATRYVDLGRLAISPQCGFASTVEGNLIALDVERKKLELVVKAALEIWGEA